MNIELPLYRQEKDNTCALACLRMVLAAFGINVPERELETRARMEPEGTLIDEVEALARQYHLRAQVQDTTVEELQRILADGKLPIAYIDRAVFELRPRERARHSIRNAIIHTVIPTRVTAKSVTFHDPRQPHVSRRTVRLFSHAYLSLGGPLRCVRKAGGSRVCVNCCTWFSPSGQPIAPSTPATIPGTTPTPRLARAPTPPLAT